MKKVPIILIFLFLTAILFDTIIANAVELTSSECACELNDALKEGDWQKAVESAESLIAESPISEDAQRAYLWLGLYHKSQYDFGKSFNYYQTAAELFPKTWASAEATARTGCNYYKLNNYSKALEYFRKAGENAKTWQQRKYASAWAKWVHFALAGKEQQLVTNCATESINYYLNSKEIKLNRTKIASSLTLKDGLVSLSDILSFLKKENIEFTAVKCPLERIEDLQLPFVAAVKPSHMIVIKDIEKDIDKKIEKVKVYDPVLGEISYYEDELAKIWSEKVLTVSNPNGQIAKKNSGNIFAWIGRIFTPSDKKFASLTKRDLDNVLLGACYCCPQDTITECDADSDDCSACNGAGAGAGGGSGGGSGPGTGGGGCSSGRCTAEGSSDMGFPKMEVYTPTLSLIVRDTPIGYITPIGEDVKITLTFNSDLSDSGMFGNSWSSNLETKVSENPGYSATIRRSGGHDSVFYYSGGEYSPPVGCSNKLVKNQDGTFTLEFTKSHRKYYYDMPANGGKILAIEDRNGNILSYQYDANSNLDSITDAVGRITDFNTATIYGSTRVTSVTDPLGREATFTYDANNGNLTGVVDMAGNSFTYSYDENNNIVSFTEPKGTYTIEYDQWSYEIWVSSITDPNGNEYLYGGEWPTYVQDPRGNTTYYYSDWYYSWPGYGDTLMIEDELGNYIEYTYDDDRNKTEIRDKRGNTTSYTYDPNHNMTSKTDPCDNTWSYVYDANNNNLVSATDPRGKITAYVHDSNDNLLSITEKDPNQTTLSLISYTYDANGLMTSMTANGKTTDYDYDPNGNLIQVTDPEDNITTFTYDIVGRKLSMTNDANVTTTYEYDDLNRITKITHPDSTYVQYTYNCCGLSQKRDENTKTTDYDYDELGRLIKVTDANDNETVYAYDSVGNLVSLTDARDNTTSYTYDELNRVTDVNYPLSDSESYTYDENGNILTKTDGNGHTTHYTYDKNNRLIKIQY